MNDKYRTSNTADLDGIQAVASAANQSLELEQVLRLSFAKAMEVTRAAGGALYMLDKPGKALQLRVARGAGSEKMPPRLPLEGGGLNAKALRRKRALCGDDILAIPPALNELVLENGNYACVPLTVKGRAVGTLMLLRPAGDEFSPRDRGFLEGMGFQIGLGIGNANLFQSVREMTRHEVELESANERLRAIDEMKNALLANVSHELRTPLVPIGGFTRMVHDGKVGELSPTQREFLGIVLRNVDRLGQIVENLLSFSSLQPGSARLTLGTFRIGTLIDSVLQEMEPLASTAKVRLVAEIAKEDMTVRGDPGKIRQVIDHLVVNAIKFNRAAGRVVVRAARANNEVEIQVEDNGQGIATHDLPHIFERFYKADAFSKGTGIGLALVKQILLLHGKDIWAESHLGQGSQFSFRLSAAEKTPFRDTDLAKTVLVVDDEPDTVEFERTVLEQEGFRVLEAENGPAAIDVLDRESVGVVLLDLKMPGMDGIEVCRRIKEDPRLHDVNVQIVTARSDEPMVRQSYQAGADGYILKPFDTDSFVNKVAAAFRGRTPTNGP
ncbi:MAG: response regulator [Pseudomonadota bacterium]